MHFIKAPFDSFESKYNKDHREEMYKAQQDVKALEARVKAMEKEDEPATAAIANTPVANFFNFIHYPLFRAAFTSPADPIIE